MIMSLIISRVIFHYFLYLSNIIILHEVHLLSNYTFPTQELIFESFALPSLENTIGTISPILLPPYSFCFSEKCELLPVST